MERDPDGRWLAYEPNESGQFEIYVRPFPAVDQGRWQVSTAGGWQPSWARSGRELFYWAPDGILMAVAVGADRRGASFTAGTPAKLVEGQHYTAAGDVNLGRTYAVSPGGRRFLMIKEGGGDQARAPENLIVVENWLEELKRLVPTKRSLASHKRVTT